MAKINLPSFAKGELSPELHGRVDTAAYASGLALARNCIVHTYGGVSRRPGTRFIGIAKEEGYTPRLIPFQFKTADQYILEFGHEYMRVIRNDAYVMDGSEPFEISTPYHQVNLFELNFVQSADVMTIVHPEYLEYELSRIEHDDWTLVPMNVGSLLDAPTGVNATSNDGSGTTYTYRVTASSDDFGEESSATQTTVSGGATPNNTITWNAVTGADRYLIYRLHNGVFGFIGESETTSFTDVNIAPETSIRPPKFRNPFILADDHPRAVGYFEQRRVFGGSNARPDTSEFSQVGLHSNFNRSFPIQADDAITATLSSREVNEIRHYVAQNDLLVFTSGSEWRIGSGPDTFFGPETIRQKPQSEWGSSLRQPLMVGNTIVFNTADGGNVRSFGYEYQIDNYTGVNLNVLARHLLQGHFIKDWCYTRLPDSRIYMVRDDGVALTLSFDPEQEVIAWTWFETDGEFEACASLRGGGTFSEDSVYWVVKREVDGNTLRYIEVMRDTFFDDVKDCFFVDSGLSYNGVPVSTVANLDHLEGKEVVALADGNFVSDLVVEDGQVSFPFEAERIHVGLLNTADIETLDIETGQGTIQGDRKRVIKVVVKFFKSRGLFIGPDPEHLTEMKQREFELMGDPTELLTGMKEIVIPASWNSNGRIRLHQQYPLPMTVLAIIPHLDVEDDA